MKRAWLFKSLGILMSIAVVITLIVSSVSAAPVQLKPVVLQGYNVATPPTVTTQTASSLTVNKAGTTSGKFNGPLAPVIPLMSKSGFNMIQQTVTEPIPPKSILKLRQHSHQCCRKISLWALHIITALPPNLKTPAEARLTARIKHLLSPRQPSPQVPQLRL